MSGIEQFLPGSIGFGVVAPSATKRAALEKDRGSYPRPVVYAEFLYIKNESHKKPLS
jgi:hypothetical protein